MNDFWITNPRLPQDEHNPPDRMYVRAYGRGEPLLLAVHGFGRNGRRMERLALSLADQFTTLAPDLPYHGQTEWYSERYDVDVFTAMLQQLLDEHGRNRPVYLLGHSLGGRYLSSCLAGLHHDDLRDLVLVAPDGAGGRYTNWIDTLPRPIMRGLARMTERPRHILRLTRWLRKRGFINSYSADYLKYNLNDRPFRRRLAGTLRSVLHFPPRPRAFQQALENHDMQCTVFVGDRDPLLHHDRLIAMYTPLPAVELHPYSGSHWLPERLLARYYANKSAAALP